MICDICIFMLRQVRHYTSDRYCGPHHQSLSSLERALDGGCPICHVVASAISDRGISFVSSADAFSEFQREWVLVTFQSENPTLCIQPQRSIRRLENPRIQRVRFELVQIHLSKNKFDLSSLGSGPCQVSHPRHSVVSSTTAAHEVASLALDWFATCRDNHECSITSDPSWYPPRLLDVTTAVPRLVDESELQHQGAGYAALSHCWGKEPFLYLDEKNETTFQTHGLSIDELPQNFRDAIQICRWLKLPYIWIDSLCILQSGNGSQADWEHHVKIMELVYSNSAVCISTAAAASAKEGCLKQRDARIIRPVAIDTMRGPSLVVAKDHTMRGFRNARIGSRGWTFQERLLSPRILSIGEHQIFWECRHTNGQGVSETFPDGVGAEFDHRGPFCISSQPIDLANGETSLFLWRSLIEVYAECDLTRADEDKFAAFAGIAKRMQIAFHGSCYVAGFFEPEFPLCLLWYRKEPSPTPIQSTTYRAPSWSWAAVDAIVFFRRVEYRHAELIAHSVTLGDPQNPFGPLIHAEIELNAPLLRVRDSNIFTYSEPNLQLCKIHIHRRDFDYKEDSIRRQMDEFVLLIGSCNNYSYALIVQHADNQNDADLENVTEEVHEAQGIERENNDVVDMEQIATIHPARWKRLGVLQMHIWPESLTSEFEMHNVMLV